jgi:hypothetical protein
MASIEEWITENSDPTLPLRQRPDLIEAVKRGREAGLTWGSLARWLHTQGIDMNHGRLAAVMRRV